MKRVWRKVLFSAVVASTMLATLPAAAGHADSLTGHAARADIVGHQHGLGRQAARAAVVVRHATRQYHRLFTAEASGYEQFLTCVQEPGQGAMGTHWVHGSLVADATIDPVTPEALMYETRPNGTLALVGVEYIVFQQLWDAENDQPPQLFGHDFHLVSAPNRYGIPAFYALHVWAWKYNPSGTFSDWNPRVTCRHAAGSPI